MPVLTGVNRMVRTSCRLAKNNRTDVQRHAKIYTRLTDTLILSWLLLGGLIRMLSVRLSCSHCWQGKEVTGAWSKKCACDLGEQKGIAHGMLSSTEL